MHNTNGEFLCEVYLTKDKPGHCPFPGTVVRHTVYQGKRLRTVLCGEHSGVFEGWETLPLDEYRRTYGLIPDAPIIGERIAPVPEITCFVESAKNAETSTERNMWISMHRAARALADFRYWAGHFAAFPLDVNMRQYRDTRTQWEHAKEHAEGMHAIYAREDHGQERPELPDYFLHSITCKAAEIVRSRKR
jgi:hypothetical protein